ncbi:MAG TPA: glycosyltransferase, partial [Candidatus Saccharimonadales bacterium]|nr:glycosyltransferase [Candidatus Saccharimonadales bacterium]
MNLVILSHRYAYPPDRGDRLTLFNFLRVVVPRHQVRLLSVCQRPPAPDSVAAVRALGVEARAFPLARATSLWQSGLALAGRGSLQVAYFRSPALLQAVREVDSLGPADCVIAHAVRMVAPARALRARRRIFMAQDCLSLALRRSAGWARWPMSAVLREEATRMARAETEAADWADEVWLVSEADAQHFPTPHRGKLRVVRHGIAADSDPAARWMPDGQTLLFVGRMDVRHNVEAARRLCERVLPRVRRAVPGARARVVGSSPAPAVRRLARLPGVEVAGSVARVQDAYATATVLVAPLTFATGIQNKILEAAAAG